MNSPVTDDDSGIRIIGNEKFLIISNDIMDALVRVNLSGAQFKIVHCVIRYTLGFNRESHKMSISFISKATGIHISKVKPAMSKLIDAQIITVYKPASFNQTREVGINLNLSEWKLISTEVPKEVPGTQIKSRSPKKHKPGTQTGTQENTLRNHKKNNNNVKMTEDQKTKEPKKSTEIRQIFDYYNSLGLVIMKKYTDTIRDAIEGAIKKIGSEKELKILMDRHREVVQMTKASDYPVIPRNIQKFLTQKTSNIKGAPFIYEEYMEGGDKYERYLRKKRPEKRLEPLPMDDIECDMRVIKCE